MTPSATFEEMRDFVSKHTPVASEQITPDSHLMKDLFFDMKDGPHFLEAYSSRYHVDMAACNPGKHFEPHHENSRKTLYFAICLVPLLFIFVRLLSHPEGVSAQLSTSHQLLLGAIALLNVYFAILIAVLLKARKRTGSEQWEPQPEVDLSLIDLTRIANAGVWPKEMYKQP